jgi:hypothetical protein
MKILDYSPINAETNPLKKIQAHIQGILRYGFAWENDLKAQELVINLFKNRLDRSYTALRHLVIQDADIYIPLILVGPPGITMVNVKSNKGVFRARGDAWLEMDRKTHKYQTAQENLIGKTQILGKVLDTYLSKKNQSHPGIQTALLLANPGAHVEASRPSVRIVRIDGVDRFVSGLVQENEVLPAADAQAVVDALAQAMAREPKVDKSRVELGKIAQETSDKITDASQIKLPPGLERFRMKKREAILLILMSAFEFMLLIALILFVLLAS